MKFAEHLAAHITPEWRKQYISYEVGHVRFCNVYNILCLPFFRDRSRGRLCARAHVVDGTVNTVGFCFAGNERNAVRCHRTGTSARPGGSGFAVALLCQVRRKVFQLLRQRTR